MPHPTSPAVPLDTSTTDAANPASGHETIVVIDFGAQYSLLIARRIRELNIYCEVLPWDAGADRVRGLDLRGIILSGGPNSVY